jgi:hypothetical protein
MFYTWQTWDLNSIKKLGTSLKMCNGKKESSDMVTIQAAKLTGLPANAALMDSSGSGRACGS